MVLAGIMPWGLGGIACTTRKGGQKQLFSRLNRSKTACFGVLLGYMGVYWAFSKVFEGLRPCFRWFLPGFLNVYALEHVQNSLFWVLLGLYGRLWAFSRVFDGFRVVFDPVFDGFCQVS